MYYIINISLNPPVRIENLEFKTELESSEWIDNNGGPTLYSFIFIEK